MRIRNQFAQIIFVILFLLPTIKVCAQYDDNLDVVQEKENIYDFLMRHELPPSLYRKVFIELNRGKFRGDTLLIAGTIYTIPKPFEKKGPAVSKPTTITEPLFGKKYEKIPIVDNSLDGAVFYLVSGHGGPDPGALGQYGNHTISEDEYAYDVTLRLARNLMSRGARVYMIVQDKENGIRDDAILKIDKTERLINGQTIPLNHKDRLQQRVDEVNRLFNIHRGAFQRMVEIHIDSRGQGQNIDVFFYYHKGSAKGQQLAREIQKVFEMKYARHQPGRSYNGTVSDRSGLYSIRYSLPPIVYIELGNIRNYRDQQRLVIPDNRQALANWIELGIVNDFKKSKD